MIKVTWTGAAGLTFETGEENILIDPYYTRVSIINTLFRRISPDPAAISAALPDMNRIKAIIVGHTHSDHAMDVPFIAARTKAPIIGSTSLDTLMALSGLPNRTTVCSGGETIGLSPSASVTMLRSLHGLVAMGKVPFKGEIQNTHVLPMQASGYRVGTVFAPKLEINGVMFQHNGSANFIETETEGHQCDVLFLCVPGWKKRAGYPQKLLEITQPSQVVLFHYDDFSRPHLPGSKTRRIPMLDLPGLVKRIKAYSPTIEIIVPEVGQTIDF